MTADPIVGTWLLESMERHNADGSVVKPMGEAPVGRLTYTADGYMQAILMPAGRAPFESGDLYGTAEERERGGRHFVAYAGRYERRGDVMLHFADVSFFPNWVGTEQRRKMVLDGDTLTLSTEPEKAGGPHSVGVLVWKRRTGNNP